MDSLDDAARIHDRDQAEEHQISQARQYATFYRTLIEGGVPAAIAAEMVQREQGARWQLIFMGQGAPRGWSL